MLQRQALSCEENELFLRELTSSKSNIMQAVLQLRPTRVVPLFPPLLYVNGGGRHQLSLSTGSNIFILPVLLKRSESTLAIII